MNPFPHYRSQFSATSATSATPTPISPSKFLFIPIIHYFSTKNHQNSIFLNYFLISICKTLNVHRTFALANAQRSRSSATQCRKEIWPIFGLHVVRRSSNGLWTVSVKKRFVSASKFLQNLTHRPPGFPSSSSAPSPSSPTSDTSSTSPTSPTRTTITNNLNP